MARTLGALIFLVGCDAVFGLDGDHPGDGSVDARLSPTEVSFDLGVAEITQGPADTIVTTHAAASGAVTVTLADGTMPTLVATSTGYMFERAAKTQPYRVAYVDPGTLQRTTYVGAAQEVHIETPILGRLAREAPPVGTMLAFTVSSTTLFSYVYTTGLRVLASGNPAVPTAFTGRTLDWDGIASLSGPVGLLRADKGDRFVHATYARMPAVTGYYTLFDVASAPVSLAPAVTTTLTLPVPTLVTTSCLALTARRTREQQRLIAATGVVDVHSEWRVSSTPAPLATEGGGIPIAFDPTTVTSDTEQMVQLAAASAGETLVATLSTTADLDLGHGVVAQVTGSTTALVPTLSCALPVPALALEGTTGFAREIVVDGSVVSWALFDGVADVYTVDVHDVAEVRTTLRRYVTSETSLALDADALLPGHSYWIEIAASSGRPGAPTGDFRPLAYPVGTTRAASRVFTVD